MTGFSLDKIENSHIYSISGIFIYKFGGNKVVEFNICVTNYRELVRNVWFCLNVIKSFNYLTM